MPMRLHSSPASPYVRKVIVVAHEVGLIDDIELLDTAVSPVAVETVVAADNPLGKIPCLVTEAGEAFYDSRVIAEYLDSRHGGHKLFPHEGPTRWLALRRMALGDGICDAAVLGRYETFVRPRERQWDEWVLGQKRKITRALDQLEREAEAFPPWPDIAQIAVGCALGYLDFRYAADEWRDGRSALAAWYEDFAHRPSMGATRPPSG